MPLSWYVATFGSLISTLFHCTIYSLGHRWLVLPVFTNSFTYFPLG